MGKLGAVICWENNMPLLRMTMFAKGIQLYSLPRLTAGIPGSPRCSILLWKAAVSCSPVISSHVVWRRARDGDLARGQLYY